MRFFVLIFLLAFAVPSYAQEEDMLCTLLSIYKSEKDVNYQEGVDVNGNAVVPADINAAQIDLPAAIRIPLQVDMANRLERLMAINIKADAPLGLIQVYENGRVTYEGKNITNSASAACALSHKVAPDMDVAKEPLSEKMSDDFVRSNMPDENVQPVLKTQDDVDDVTSQPEAEIVDKDRKLLYGQEHKELNKL